MTFESVRGDESREYCRMLNVHDLGTSDVRGVLLWRTSHLAFYFSYESIIFCEFYFHDSKEPCGTRVIKLS